MLYEEAKKELLAISTESKKDISSFDKNFFLVSFAIFAFTVTFIKDIVPYTSSRGAFFLAASWFLMGISLSLTICAYFVSAISREYMIYKIYPWLEKKKKEGQYSKIPTPPKKEEPNSGPEPSPDIASHQTEYDDINFLHTRKHNFLQYLIRASAIAFLIAGLFTLLIYILLNHRLTASLRPLSTEDSTKAVKIAIDQRSRDSLSVFYNQTLTRKDSSILQIKSDTIRLVTSGCTCPPNSHVCKKTCH
jgi:hypothetical protein